MNSGGSDTLGVSGGLVSAAVSWTVGALIGVVVARQQADLAVVLCHGVAIGQPHRGTQQLDRLTGTGPVERVDRRRAAYLPNASVAISKLHRHARG